MSKTIDISIAPEGIRVLKGSDYKLYCAKPVGGVADAVWLAAVKAGGPPPAPVSWNLKYEVYIAPRPEDAVQIGEVDKAGQPAPGKIAEK